MIGKVRIGLAALVVAVAAMGVLAGCEWLGIGITFDWTDSANIPYARVTDEAGIDVAGAVVTLTGTSTLTATTNSSGVATFTGFTSSNAGAYEMSASLAGYTFYATSVTIGENSVYLGTLVAYVPAVITATVTGAVTDARLSAATGAIAGATAKLFVAGATTETATTTTDATGTFTFTDVGTGSYKVTVTKTDYAFIDKSFDVSEINAEVNIGAVLGFSSVGNKISLIAVWSSAFNDVDSHFTIPTGDLWTSTPSMADPYDMPTSGIVAGFLPATSGREDIYYGNKNSTVLVSAYSGTGTTSAVTLDRDVMTGSGPETITIHSLPMPALAATINFTIVGSPTGNGLPTDTAYNYAWVGVAEYYLHAYGTPTMATEGVSGGAAAVVYVVQGSAIKGRFTVPDYMAIDKASVVRVNMFLRKTAAGDAPVYQFLPDIRIADYSGIRSVAGVDNAPLVLFGDPRN